MNNIVPFGERSIRAYHPLDVLHSVNPEIAGLAYANNEGILNSEIMPLAARFRELQSGEKIALIGAMAQRYGYDAQIEINRESEGGMTTRTRIIDGGMTRRTELSENGMTQRAATEGANLITLQKLKYEFGRAVVQDHIEGQKYLSDNELKATVFEAQAQAESIRLTEMLRSETAMEISRNELEGVIRTSEIKHASLIKRAEIERGMARGGNKKEIAIAYIKAQAEINHAMIECHIEAEKTKAIVGTAYYTALNDIGHAGMEFLERTGNRRISFRGKGTYGELNLDIETE